jgi:hypothetical protein
MTGLFAPDGCVAPNIPTQDYRLTFTAKCEHGKVRGAQIVISAPSEADALQFAATWLQQGVMKNTTLTGIELVRCICGATDMGDDSWDLDVRPDCPIHSGQAPADQPTMAEDPF